MQICFAFFLAVAIAKPHSEGYSLHQHDSALVAYKDYEDYLLDAGSPLPSALVRHKYHYKPYYLSKRDVALPWYHLGPAAAPSKPANGGWVDSRGDKYSRLANDPKPTFNHRSVYQVFQPERELLNPMHNTMRTTKS